MREGYGSIVKGINHTSDLRTIATHMLAIRQRGNDKKNVSRHSLTLSSSLKSALCLVYACMVSWWLHGFKSSHKPSLYHRQLDISNFISDYIPINSHHNGILVGSNILSLSVCRDVVSFFTLDKWNEAFCVAEDAVGVRDCQTYQPLFSI